MHCFWWAEYLWRRRLEQRQPEQLQQKYSERPHYPEGRQAHYSKRRVLPVLVVQPAQQPLVERSSPACAHLMSQALAMREPSLLLFRSEAWPRQARRQYSCCLPHWWPVHQWPHSAGFGVALHWPHLPPEQQQLLHSVWPRLQREEWFAPLRL